MQYASFDELVGKRVIYQILDNRGMLLIPEGTVLRPSHIAVLTKFKIDIYDIHVELVQNENDEQSPPAFITEAADEASPSPPPSPSPSLQFPLPATRELVKRAEQQFKNIDEFVHKNGKVPIADVEDKMFPIIMEATNKRNLFQLFSDLKAEGDFRYAQSIGVAIVATLLGKWLQLDKRELSLLTTAASLYDIGSLKLPAALVNKPAWFQPHEFEIVKQHTVLGYELLEQSDVDHRVALVALQHHERGDGSGYPHRLKDDRIDRLSKIVAIADVYLAMTSERPHRPPFAFYEVIRDIQKGILHHRFDSLIGLTFLNRLMSAQIGSDVILSDNRRGKIIVVNANYPASPLIAAEDECIDLSKTDAVRIKEIVG